MIRASIRQVCAPLWVIAAAVLASCSDKGVNDPGTWLRENNSYLNEVVRRLGSSSIIRVQSQKYESASKLSSSEDDAKLYGDLKKFMDAAGLISIEVIRGCEGDARPLKGISFHVKEIGKFSDLSEVSVVYAEPSVNPETFFQNPSCKKADTPSWFVCTWKPR